MSFLSNFLFGKPSKFEQIPTITPEQKGLLDQLLGALGGTGAMGGPLGSGIQNLQNILGGGPEAFKAFEAPAKQHLNNRLSLESQRDLLEQMPNNQGAFGQTLGAAGANLEQNLAAQRSGLQSQALGQLQQLLGQGLQPQFQTQGIPGQTGVLQGLMSLLGQGAGAVGQTAFTGGLGGLLGGQGFGRGIQRGFGF